MMCLCSASCCLVHAAIVLSRRPKTCTLLSRRRRDDVVEACLCMHYHTQISPEVPKAKLCPYFGVKTKVCPSHASHANPLPGWIKHNIWQIKSASWDRAKVSPWMGIRMLLSNAPGAWDCLSWGRQHICSWVWFPNVSSFITIRYDKQPRYWSTRLLLFMVFVIWLQYQRCWSNGYVRYSNYEALGHGRITSQCAHGFQSLVPGCCPWSGRCRSFLAGI